MTEPGVVVVGASLAGFRTVKALRDLGHEGRITLVGDEVHAPYDRPALSKSLLRGAEVTRPTFYADHDALAGMGVTVRLGSPARGVDLDAREVLVGDEAIPYTELVVATGCRAATVPGLAGHSGVHVVRTWDDAERLRAVLATGPKRVTVLGFGYIGSEVAATASGAGHEVTVVNPAETVFAGLGEHLSRRLHAVHTEHGVRIRTGVRFVALEETGPQAVARLSDGSGVITDVLVVAVGARPVTGWLAGSSLDLSDGVVCDSGLRAAQHVHAVGDVASWESARFGRRLRVEHWTNATEQARHVARSLVDGVERPYPGLPYFWSEQFDHMVQGMGLTRGHEAAGTRTLAGPDGAMLTLFAGLDDTLVGAAALDATATLMRLRRPIVSGEPSAQVESRLVTEHRMVPVAFENA